MSLMMIWRWARGLAPLVALVLLAAAAALAAPDAWQAPAARRAGPERPVPFKVGETLEYDVSWSSYLIAGTATVTVQEKKPSYGSTAYYIYAEGRSTPLLSRLYPVYYKADTLLDVYTLLPQRGSVYGDENGRRAMKITRFDQANRTADYEVSTATVVTNRFPVPRATQDALSAFFVLRTCPLVKGATITMPVADNGTVQTVRMTVGAKEQVRTGAGSFRAWRITPVVTDGEGRQGYSGLVVWISDDARRLPVKLEAELAVGRFALVLRAAKP